MSLWSFWAASWSWRSWAWSLRTSSRVSSWIGRCRKRVVSTRIPWPASEYSELLTVCGGSGVTTSSNGPTPSGTSTSRVTRAMLG